ncbi:hypothetical protein [Chthonobacter rhizosphaerae]|uniref:hypothetical protein n=1 Tax=Chthonobacter rhizosphaerae TaxID=2735553 RepID=UPI0015EF06C6|nr:hypothetical protein [Chthonobacter rhizosphaerae]
MNARLLSLAAALSLTALSAAPAVADIGLVAPQPSVHAAGYGFTHDFGSKHAVGTFAKDGQTCNLTVVIADRVSDDDIPAMGSRIQVSVAAGNGANVSAPDGQGFQVACSADARHVVVKPLADGI